LLAFSFLMVLLSLDRLVAKTQGGREAPAIAKCVSEKGSVLVKGPGGGDWHVVEQNGNVPGAGLVVGLPGAEISSLNEAVALQFQGNFEGKAPHPVIEAAVRMFPAQNVDLMVTLDRGWVELINQKPSGKATVRLSVQRHVWNITLQSPGTRLALI